MKVVANIVVYLFVPAVVLSSGVVAMLAAWIGVDSNALLAVVAAIGGSLVGALWRRYP